MKIFSNYIVQMTDTTEEIPVEEEVIQEEPTATKKYRKVS